MHLLCPLLLSILMAGACLAQEVPELPSEALTEESGPPELLNGEPIAVDPGDDPLQKLLKERHNAAALEVRILYTFWSNGQTGFLELDDSIQQRLDTVQSVSSPTVSDMGSLRLETRFLSTAQEVYMKAVVGRTTGNDHCTGIAQRLIYGQG